MRARLLVVLVAVVARGCGGGSRPRASATTAPARAGAPFPSDFTPMRAGTTYVTRRFRPALSVTPVGGGWSTEVGDSPEHLSMTREDLDGVDQAILALTGSSASTTP